MWDDATFCGAPPDWMLAVASGLSRRELDGQSLTIATPEGDRLSRLGTPPTYFSVRSARYCGRRDGRIRDLIYA
jgi:hypothetical protein